MQDVSRRIMFGVALGGIAAAAGLKGCGIANRARDSAKNVFSGLDESQMKNHSIEAHGQIWNWSEQAKTIKSS